MIGLPFPKKLAPVSCNRNTSLLAVPDQSVRIRTKSAPKFSVKLEGVVEVEIRAMSILNHRMETFPR
jgi:hypothetical protein